MASTIGGTLKHAKFLARHLNRCAFQYAAVAVLLELEVPTNRIGFEYLKQSIIIYVEDPAQAAMKGIYPTISSLYDPEPTAQQIEQAMRSAINEAWENRDEKVWRHFFRTDRDGNVEKPSNIEFISKIARFLELWKACCEEVTYERA